MSNHRRAALLVRAAHPEPTVAVSLLAALLAMSFRHGAAGVILVAAAVLTGQLSIGWSNDLVDVARDRRVHRRDKPLATGALAVPVVRTATACAVVASVVLSFACGVASACAHLGLVVGSGWAYNLWLKRSWWSWLPYAVAFGTLPSVAGLALPRPELAPWWMTLAGALLGVGAHLVNVLPDLADDAVTGVTGLPHRLGRRRTQVAATAVLTAASLAVVLGPPDRPSMLAWTALVVTTCLAAVGLLRSDGAPFRAALAIAVLDVVLLLVS